MNTNDAETTAVTALGEKIDDTKGRSIASAVTGPAPSQIDKRQASFVSAKVLGEGNQDQLAATNYEVQSACDANEEKVRSLLLSDAAVPHSLEDIRDQCRKLLTSIKSKIKNSRLQRRPAEPAAEAQKHGPN